MASMASIDEEGLDASSRPLKEALRGAQAFSKEKAQLREALEAEAQEVAQVRGVEKRRQGRTRGQGQGQAGGQCQELSADAGLHAGLVWGTSQHGTFMCPLPGKQQPSQQPPPRARHQ